MTTENELPHTPPKTGQRSFILLCLIGFAVFFSSYLRIPVLPLLAAELGADPARIGLINGSFLITAGLLSIPAGLLVDRLGCRRPVIAGILAIALSSLLITVCRQPMQMAAAYLLFGAGLAAFAPGMLALVADCTAPEKLGRAYGWYTTAIYIAMTVGPASGGYLAQHAGLRTVFWVSAALLGCLALVALAALPQGAARRKTELHAALGSSLQLLHNRPLRACLLATAGSCFGFGLFLTFLPLYGASLGFSPATVGLLFAAQAVTNVFGRVPIGILADRVDRRLLVSVGLCCLALALVLVGQLHRLEWLLLCAVLLGAGMALTFTAIGALIAETVPIPQRGLAMGMYNSCIYFGMVAGSAGMGLALQRVGYPLGFAAAGLVALGTAIVFPLALHTPATRLPNR